MAARPDGFARHFVPETSEVLHATRLLATGERAVLRFRAPTAAGAYPYICSFPGHWATMRGAMTVTGGAAAAPSPTLTPAP
jgi:azurin